MMIFTYEDKHGFHAFEGDTLGEVWEHMERQDVFDGYDCYTLSGYLIDTDDMTVKDATFGVERVSVIEVG